MTAALFSISCHVRSKRKDAAMKTCDYDACTDEEYKEVVDMLVSLSDGIMVGNDPFEEKKQKCRRLEARFGDGGVTAEELFDAYFEFLCYCVVFYESWYDRYCQEANKARRLVSFIDYPACLAKTRRRFDPYAQKIGRLQIESLINRVDAVIKGDWQSERM